MRELEEYVTPRPVRIWRWRRHALSKRCRKWASFTVCSLIYS